MPSTKGKKMKAEKERIEEAALERQRKGEEEETYLKKCSLLLKPRSSKGKSTS